MGGRDFCIIVEALTTTEPSQWSSSAWLLSAVYW